MQPENNKFENPWVGEGASAGVANVTTLGLKVYLSFGMPDMEEGTSSSELLNRFRISMFSRLAWNKTQNFHHICTTNIQWEGIMDQYGIQMVQICPIGE